MAARLYEASGLAGAEPYGRLAWASPIGRRPTVVDKNNSV